MKNKRVVYIGGNLFYDGLYTKGKEYMAEVIAEEEKVYRIVSDNGLVFHPPLRTLQTFNDVCGDCKNRCRSEKGKCGFYEE